MTAYYTPLGFNECYDETVTISIYEKITNFFFALIKVNVYYNPVLGDMRHNPTTARRLCLVEKVWAMIFNMTFCINEILFQSPQVMILTWLLQFKQMYLFISTKYHRKTFYSKIVATRFLQSPLWVPLKYSP